MRRLSLRVRITSGSLAVAAGALSVAGLVVTAGVQQEMTAQVDASLRADADFTRRATTTGPGLPMGEGPTDLYVQFVDSEGVVVASGTAAAGLPDLSPAGQVRGSIVTVEDPALGQLRVLSAPAPSAPEMTLVLARSSHQVGAVHDRLIRLLVALVLIGSVLLGVLIWIVVGRALRPVESMRCTVDGIQDSDLRTRVERPGTGDELDRLAGTLNELLDRLESAVARERRFVADASHDLRTPIAAVRALLETKAADPEADAAGRAEALVRVGQLQDLADQLLALARADAVSSAPDSPVDLDDVVLAHARQLARHTGVRVDTSRVSGGQVAGSDVDLDRLVENLASNAARFARSTVAFSVHQTGDVVELAVDDDGPGVDPGDRSAVFDRFRTLDAARSQRASGAGLGLAIALAIVESHHGTIRVTDAPIGGARFEVRLPAYRPDRSLVTTESRKTR